jgi:hypothetical protein
MFRQMEINSSLVLIILQYIDILYMHDFLEQITFEIWILYRKNPKRLIAIFIWYVNMYYEILHIIMQFLIVDKIWNFW